MHELMKTKHNKPRKGRVISCARCGKEKYASPSNIKAKFCSRKCCNDTEKEKGTSRMVKCLQCTKGINRPPSQIKAKNFCSKECMDAHYTLPDEKRTTPNKKASDGLRWEMWSVKYADIVFSKIIRARDGRCVRCRSKDGLTCSHFWERHHSSTRYDFENCDTLCLNCHRLWEGRRNGYKEYKIEELGEKKYGELERKHNQMMKRSDSVNEIQQWWIEQKNK